MSMIMDKENVEIKGELKSFIRTVDSGGEVTSYFCPEFGNRIYGTSPFNADAMSIKPGTLDDTSWLTPSRMLWMNSAQNWVPVPDSMETEEFQGG